MKNNFMLPIVMLFFLLQGGCTAETSLPEPVEIAQHPAATSITQKPTPILRPSPILDPPSKTPWPSRTPSYTPTRTATSTPSETYDAAKLATTADEETLSAYWYAYLSTEAARFPDCGSVVDRDFSPNHKWLAMRCLDATGVYSLIDDTRPFFMRRGEYQTDGKPLDGYYFPVHWSGDGRYLYLSFYPQYGDGGCVAYHQGIILQRLDLFTGEITTTLPGTNWKFYNFAFSQDDRYLSYFQSWLNTPILKILNLTNSEMRRIPIGEQYSGAGNVVWSPDNSYIIFSARTGLECEEMVYYLILLKLDDLSQTIITYGAEAFYRPLHFSDDHQLVVQLGYGNDNYFSIDLGNFVLSPYATSSPMPWPTLIP